MPIGINPVQRGESDLDKVLKGFQIAEAVIGSVDRGASAYKKIAGPSAEEQDLEFAKAGYPRSPIADVPTNAAQFGGSVIESSAPNNSAKPLISQPPTVMMGGVQRIDTHAQKAQDSAARDKRDYDQRERAIEATRSDREFQKNKPSDAQAQAAGFGKRMQQAESEFRSLTDAGYNRADLKNEINSKIPGVVTAVLPAYGQTPENQRQEQAERNFINATLRRESGSAIAASEFASAEKQYFPRAGDAVDVIAQKLRNREQVLESMRVASGPAWEQVKSIQKENKPPSGFDPKAAAAELAKRRDKKKP